MTQTNGISFQGEMHLATWKQLKQTSQLYKTSKAQDKLIKSFVNDKVALNGEETLSKNDSKFLHKLIEQISGKKINNSNGRKKVYNYENNIYIKDVNARLFDGMETSFTFNV